MHAEGGVPARRVRHLDRGDRRAVVAEIMRTVADPGAPSFHLTSKAHPLQLPHAVRRQKYPCPDLAERGRLLIDGNIEAVGDQRVRGEQPANSASNDHDSEPRLRHRSHAKNASEACAFKLSFLAANTKRRQFTTGRRKAAAGGVWMPGSAPDLPVRRHLGGSHAASGVSSRMVTRRRGPVIIRTVPSKSSFPFRPAERPMRFRGLSPTGCRANGASRWSSRTARVQPETSAPNRSTIRRPTATPCSHHHRRRS